MDVFNDTALQEGFSDLVRVIEELRVRLSRHRGALQDAIADFNELAIVSASLWVFVTAGRGSKLEEVKSGALLCDSDLMYVDDKNVADERGSRIIPSTFASRWSLYQYTTAQKLISQKIKSSRGKHIHDVWSELSQDLIRFEAVFFQTIDLEYGKPRRTPIRAQDVQSVASRYFSSEKNFMRHVVITRWTLERFDASLLRGLTGHAWEGAQVPVACSTYSPLSAIAAMRQPLETLLKKWVSLPEECPDLTARLMEIPLRRVHKCHGAYRRIVIEGRQGPQFSRWHLVAALFCDRVRPLVLLPNELSQPAQLWLSLVFFDGLHETCDLAAIFRSSHAFLQGQRGWTIRWRRPGDRVIRVVAAQIATGGLLDQMVADSAESSIVDIEREVCGFIEKHFPETLSRKGDSQTSSADICLSSCALWLDLIGPTAIQTNYAEVNHGPVISQRSAARLIDKTDAPSVPPLGNFPRTSDGHGNKQLEQLLSLVHHVGDSNHQLGEEKARARYYEDHVKTIGSFSAGSLPGAIDQAIHHNIKLQQHGAAGRIKFSSVSTYLSSITPALKQIANENLFDLDEEGLFTVGKLLTANADDLRLSDVQKSNVRSAAFWILKTLRQLGYALPSEHQLQDPQSTALSGTSQAIPLLDRRVLIEAQRIIQSRNENQLDQERLLIALELLFTAPLRWMEVATLNTSHVLAEHPAIRIEPSGFGHIKTSSSTRTIELEQQLVNRLRDLANRVQRQRSHLKFPLIFGYLDPAHDDTEVSNWIHQELTWIFKHVLADDFRIHHFRANVITQMLFPSWTDMLDKWLDAQASGEELQGLFSWSPQTAWRSESVSSMAGHSHPRSSVYYYLFAGPLLRSLFMASVNSRLQPSSHSLKPVGISVAAHTKACQRDPRLASNRWNHIAQKLWNPSANTTIELASAHSNEQQQRTVSQQAVEANRAAKTLDLRSDRYLCLRCAGLAHEDAEDICALNFSEGDRLEKQFDLLDKSALSTLQEREGTSAGERSLRAEVELIRSALFEDLHQIFRSAPQSSRRALLALLRPKLSQSLPDEPFFRQASSLFDRTSYVLEVVFGRRHVDVELNTKLSRLTSLRIGIPARDISRHPRAFVVLRDDLTSTVLKSRLRSVCSVLLFVIQ